MFIWTKFRDNRSRDLNLKARKTPQKFDKDVKGSLIQKRFQHGKKILVILYITTYSCSAFWFISSMFVYNYWKCRIYNAYTFIGVHYTLFSS